MAMPSAAAPAGVLLSPAPLSLRPRPPLRVQQFPHTRPHRVLLLLRVVHRPAGSDLRCRRRLMTARGERPAGDDDDEEQEQEDRPRAAGFDAAVALFNRGEFHACHDVVEELWYGAEDPARTLLHGMLQCAVGFHHLFNQNHRGAMMELGEGLCKLRKLRLDDADAEPFSAFRDEVAAALQFVYCTQKELAACTDELCLTMDGSPSSYQLLGDFAAGQHLYRLEQAVADDDDDDDDDASSPSSSSSSSSSSNITFSASDRSAPRRVKVPTLHATEQHLTRLLQRTYEEQNL